MKSEGGLETAVVREGNVSRLDFRAEHRARDMPLDLSAMTLEIQRLISAYDLLTERERHDQLMDLYNQAVGDDAASLCVRACCELLTRSDAGYRTLDRMIERDPESQYVHIAIAALNKTMPEKRRTMYLGRLAAHLDVQA